MLVQKPFFIILLFSVVACRSEKESLASDKYLRWVDDIAFDPSLDDSNFLLCHGEDSVLQYFNNGEGLEYEGEKYAITKAFADNYNASKAERESGLIRLRFVINCRGETDRFRVLSMDENFNEKKFDESITNQLLDIAKSLKGWQPKIFGKDTADYYQYLIFKIHQGEIVKILP